jgi:hypothetical protein
MSSVASSIAPYAPEHLAASTVEALVFGLRDGL